MLPLPHLEQSLQLAYEAGDARHPSGISLSSYFLRAATRGRRRAALQADLLFPDALRARLGPEAARAIESALEEESYRPCPRPRAAVPLRTREWLAEGALALGAAEGVAQMWALLATIGELEEVSHRLLGPRLPRAVVRQLMHGVGLRGLRAEPFAALWVRVLKISQAVYACFRAAGRSHGEAWQGVVDRLWAPYPTGRRTRAAGDELGAYLPSLVQAASGNARRRLRRNAEAHRTHDHAQALLARFAAGPAEKLWPWRDGAGRALPDGEARVGPSLAALCFFVLLTRTASERRTRGGPSGGLSGPFAQAGFAAAEWLPDRTDELALRLLVAGEGAQGRALEAVALLVRATLAGDAPPPAKRAPHPAELSRALQRLGVDLPQGDAEAALERARERLVPLLRWLEENARELLEAG
jgi:hypothetical protein